MCSLPLIHDNLRFPLITAGHENIIALLIENGADVNTVGVFQKTILMYSANKGNNQIVVFFLVLTRIFVPTLIFTLHA